MDPLAFRRANIAEPRLRAVLDAAAERFGWGADLPDGHGAGIACGTEKGSFVATCVEVAVDPESQGVRLVRVVEAFECGAIVNPEGLRNQVEGAVVQAMGGALWEAIAFAEGRILSDRFSRYRMPRFADMPDDRGRAARPARPAVGGRGRDADCRPGPGRGQRHLRGERPPPARDAAHPGRHPAGGRLMPSGARGANLALRFLLELAAVGAGVYWGLVTGPGLFGALALALLGGGLIVAVWGAFLAPRAARRLPEPWRFGLELAVFGAAGAALAAAGAVLWGVALVVLFLINRALLSVWPQ